VASYKILNRMFPLKWKLFYINAKLMLRDEEESKREKEREEQSVDK